MSFLQKGSNRFKTGFFCRNKALMLFLVYFFIQSFQDWNHDPEDELCMCVCSSVCLCVWPPRWIISAIFFQFWWKSTYDRIFSFFFWCRHNCRFICFPMGHSHGRNFRKPAFYVITFGAKWQCDVKLISDSYRFWPVKDEYVQVLPIWPLFLL